MPITAHIEKSNQMKIKSILYNGELYDYSTERCVDCYEIVVNLDLGNGIMEAIGYLAADAPEALVKELIIQELETLSNQTK
jgi:hypothetical protein